MRKWLMALSTGVLAALLVSQAVMAQSEYTTGPGIKVSWTLNPREAPHTNYFTRGPAFGARSIQVGMDFDRDGHREFLFTTDETLAPGGPDPGILDVFLFEAAGNDSFTHVWHYSMPQGTNSLPALAWGDIDQDGLFEIYFGVPTLPPDPNKLFVFEQNQDYTFPSQPTVTWDFEKDPNADFRPAAFHLDDVDGDGKIELVTLSRTSGNRELVVASLATDQLDEFASFAVEFQAGNDVLGGGSTYDVEVVDFDGDGKKEIWANTWDNWSMAVFEADSADSYSLQVDLNQVDPTRDPGSFNSHDMYFVDMDDDGKLEGWFPMTNGVLYFIDDINDVSQLTADDVIRVGQYAPGGRSRGASIGDIDNDGRWDIVATHGRHEKVSWIEYQGLGSPADSTSYTWMVMFNSEGGTANERWYPPRIAPVDMDGDGWKEIFLTNLWASDPSQPMIVVLEYDPSSATKMASQWEFRNAIHHRDVDSLFAVSQSGNSRTIIGGFDLDQDGKKELIATDYPGHTVRVFEYNPDADVFEQVWMAPPDTSGLNRRSSNPRTVGVADFDGDEKWEIVFPLASEPSGWYVYEWDGVQGSDNYGDIYSSIIQTEIDTCCAADFKAFRADHERTTIIDIDGDGKQEMIIAIRRNAGGGKRGTLITSVDGDIEHNAGGGGFETWNVEFFVDRGQYGGGSPYHALPADLDGDGTYEIVNHTWNYFNFFNIDVLGPDQYVAPDPASPTRNFAATRPLDHVSLFGGDAADVNGDGDDEAYFPNFHTGDLWVIDYESGDDVLSIDSTHVVNIFPGAGQFYASIFDVDQNGRPNIFIGSTYPRTIVSVELMGNNPRDPMQYQAQVIYTGEPDVLRDIVVRDSAGVVTTTYKNTGAFASKVQAHWNRNPIDFDGDGQYEIIASFQGNQDSITTTTYKWNEQTSTWDTTVTKIANPKSWFAMRFEYTGQPTGIYEPEEITFVTPEDYILEQNYPNPFNPSTTIEYALPIDKRVTVRIYNMMGQVVKTLVNDEFQKAGRHRVIWDGTNEAGVRVASGTYIYSLEFGKYKKTKRMMLLK